MPGRTWRLLMAMLLGWGTLSSASAQGLALRNGAFVWFDAARMTRASASTAPVSIAVSIPEQRAYVYQAGQLIGVTTVSTGMRGHRTPAGEYSILQKRVFHRSNLYSNAPMPYMQRLTWTGIALHAGHLPGYPASHGCIRMPHAFARRLYDLTELGATVSVVNHRIDAAPPRDFPAPVEMVERQQPQPERRAAAVPPIPFPQPMLVADIGALSSRSFEVLTLSGDPPPGTAEWVTDADMQAGR
jgi:L,D-transpeptidase catalytic domain